MHRFLVRRIHIGLFEAAVAAKLKARFSNLAQAIPIEIGQRALRMLASDLEMDADGLVLDASRYVNGRYRPKAQGFTGGRLGDFGELLTYLVQRQEGNQLERVVSAVRAPRDNDSKGAIDYPQPDFIVNTLAGPRVLEVKSTEALDFQELLLLDQLPAEKRGYTWLQPCRSVSSCRHAALRQLGFGASPPRHRLKSLSGTVIPFPAQQGTAVAVLVHDGRNKQFVGNTVRFKTPRFCRTYSPPRDCWACLGMDEVPANVIMVDMPNQPDRLPLMGPGESGDSWFAAYSQWRRALWSHIPGAVSRAAQSLEKLTVRWASEIDLDEAIREDLVAHWTATLWAISFDRGLSRQPPDGYESPSRSRDWQYAEQARLFVQPSTLDEASEQVISALRERRSLRLSIESAEDGGSAGILLEAHGEARLSFLPKTWPLASPIAEDSATRIAVSLLALAQKLLGLRPFSGWQGRHPRMSPVIVVIGTKKLFLGWTIDEPELSYGYLWPNRPHSFPALGRLPEVWIFSDGRARLSLTL